MYFQDTALIYSTPLIYLLILASLHSGVHEFLPRAGTDNHVLHQRHGNPTQHFERILLFAHHAFLHQAFVLQLCPPLALVHPHPKQNVVNRSRKCTPHFTQNFTPTHPLTILKLSYWNGKPQRLADHGFLYWKGIAQITTLSRQIKVVSAFDKSDLNSWPECLQVNDQTYLLHNPFNFRFSTVFPPSAFGEGVHIIR